LASQMRSVLSSDAETVRDESGDQAHPNTPSEWPLSVASAAPVLASQMRSVWS
jgi:hypothetical protein